MTLTTLTSAAQRIVQQALQHFANRGYDAASLNDIAVSAGIKKASLYAHFTGKDELYTQVLNLALESEWAFVDAQFSTANSDAVPGSRYVDNLEGRFSNSDTLRFLLRAAYYPPATVEQKVKSGFENYLAGIGERFEALLKQAFPEVDSARSRLLAEAYLALIDSLHVELIHGNARRYARRLNALCQLIEIVGLPTFVGAGPSESDN